MNKEFVQLSEDYLRTVQDFAFGAGDDQKTVDLSAAALQALKDLMDHFVSIHGDKVTNYYEARKDINAYLEASEVWADEDDEDLAKFLSEDIQRFFYQKEIPSKLALMKEIHILLGISEESLPDNLIMFPVSPHGQS